MSSGKVFLRNKNVKVKYIPQQTSCQGKWGWKSSFKQIIPETQINYENNWWCFLRETIKCHNVEMHKELKDFSEGTLISPAHNCTMPCLQLQMPLFPRESYKQMAVDYDCLVGLLETREMIKIPINQEQRKTVIISMTWMRLLVFGLRIRQLFFDIVFGKQGYLILAGIVFKAKFIYKPSYFI